MMTELVLVEGVSDVQLISYYLQNVYGWKHESSLMVVTDRDEASDAKIRNQINSALEQICVESNRWKESAIQDSFGQAKSIYTYLLIIPANEKGALERVIIDALNDIPEETALMGEVEQFIDALKCIKNSNETHIRN